MQLGVRHALHPLCLQPVGEHARGFLLPVNQEDLPRLSFEPQSVLDQQVLPYGYLAGWTWKTSSVIELHGDACQKLKSGQVGQVQIVTGCPTEQAK